MALGGLLSEAALHPGAMREIRRAAQEGERVALACSGGADSVALVMLLWAHVPEMRGRWLILHFDHRLRGRASSGDARFVAALGRGLGEDVRVGRWSGAGTSAGEAELRDARFAFLSREMETAGVRVLALGHQADDVAETMLMRLVRGSATGGLAAPRPVHPRADGSMRVRPLLHIEARALRVALRTAGIPWREDESNARDLYTRNRIRQNVLPALREASSRDPVQGFLEARSALEEDDRALDQWTVELTRSGGLASLRGGPRALARRAVHSWIQGNGLGDALSRAAAASLIDAVAAGKPIRQSAGAGGFVRFDGQLLTLDAAPPEAPQGWVSAVKLQAPGVAVRAAGGRIEARVLRLTAKLRRSILAGIVDSGATAYLGTDLRLFYIRQRRPGDRYRPLGAPGRVRLQDAMVNRKIPRELRDLLPIVTDEGGAVVWVPGLPPAQELAVHAGTKVVVQLTYIVPKAIVPPSSVLPTLS